MNNHDDEKLFKPAAQIFWSRGLGCYVAVAPALKGVMASGQTIPEAALALERAIIEWVAIGSISEDANAKP